MRTNDFMVVGVGASAGGLDALREMLQQVPADVPAAFVVVMHLSRTHKSELATIIARFTKLKVEKITRVVLVEPGMIFVLPENSQVRISKGMLIPSTRPRRQNINKTIDYFFKSLAIDQRHNAVGVVLTGMGTDGSDGARYLHNYGGTVFVQAPSTTPFESMPCATIMRDHPESVLPPAELGKRVTRFAKDHIHKMMQR